MIEGYSRKDSVTDELISSLSNCMAQHPNERLGQLLDNAMSLYLHEMAAGAFPDQYLRETYDEMWIEALDRYSHYL